jgi:hydroxymethylpyrimidine pyrophosphatase-like HAD family hydrolase
MDGVVRDQTRGPWAKDILPRLGAPMPGVFCQGLLIYDAEGEVIYSNPLPDALAAEGIDFAKSHGVSLVAFCKVSAAPQDRSKKLPHPLRRFLRWTPNAPHRPLISTVNGNTVRSFSTHGKQSAAKEAQPQSHALTSD